MISTAFLIGFAVGIFLAWLAFSTLIGIAYKKYKKHKGPPRDCCFWCGFYAGATQRPAKARTTAVIHDPWE